MRLIVFVASLFLLNCVAAQTISSEQFFRNRLQKQKETIGKEFPSFKAKLGDSVVNNESLRGKTVFVNFWFEACPPCIAEFKGLNELYDSLKLDSSFAFISFTYETKGTIARVKKKYGLKFPIVSVSNTECYRLNQENGFPTNIILDSNLAIRHIETGGNIDIDAARWHIMYRTFPLLKRIQFRGY
ncbi:MAG TPA: TlpA disulfide reductase family protein [Chitinophagaceae bacterium]|jgi:peroxiredoxin|nr:TlpA disulfide reductase family protein [Chitinophagaceae bacterium]